MGVCAASTQPCKVPIENRLQCVKYKGAPVGKELIVGKAQRSATKVVCRPVREKKRRPIRVRFKPKER